MLAPPIEVKMTAHQIAMARLHLLYVVPLARKSGWMVLGIFALLSVTLHWFFGGRFSTWAEYLTGFFAIGGSWFLLNYTRERGRKDVARMYEEGFSLTLREEGLLYQVGEAFEVLPWEKFTRLKVASSWLFLYFDSHWALIIPRSSFQSKEEEATWISKAGERIANQNAKES